MTRGFRKGLIVAGVAAPVLVAQALAPADAAATSAWARRYKMGCESCHTGGGWRLNQMGQDFLRYGHQFEGDQAEGGFGDYTTFAYKFRYNGGDDRTESFEQHAFSIYTGGPLGQGFSYFAELYFHENSGRSEGVSDFGDFGRSKLAEAFLQYNRGGAEKYLTLRAGQILPQLLHIHNMGARTSQGRPRLWSASTINPGNRFQAFARQYGLDASYRVARVTVSAGVVNGTGTALNVVDNNQAKDVFGSIDYSFGSEGSNVGLLYYRGSYPIDAAAGQPLYTDDYHRVVAVGELAREHFVAKAAYLWGRDQTDAAGQTQDGAGLYVEGFYWPVEKAGVFLRYERWDPDTGADRDHSDGVTGGATWRMFNWGRLVVDVSKYGRTGSRPLRYTAEYNFMW